MSDHAIRIMVCILIALLVLALVALHRKERQDRQFLAELEAMHRAQRNNEDARKNKRRGYKH